jgi:sodium/hydrogen antiporter
MVLIGSDDLLASFVCGTSFAWDGFFKKQTEESSFSSVIDLLFNIAAFIYVGTWMPFASFSDATLTLSVWRLVIIGILILLLRRLPIMCALYPWIPDIKTFREAVFSGHFGPMGIGAIFISTLAAKLLLTHISENPDTVSDQTRLLADSIQPIVAFMVLCSIITHGLSIPGFSLGKRVRTASRTWSQTHHASLPEWVNQISKSGRIVGADPVGGPSANPERGSRELHDPEKGPRLDKAPDIGAEDANKVAEEMKSEGPPDGRELVMEWKEGPHKVVEERAAPGEEVGFTFRIVVRTLICLIGISQRLP